MGNGSGEKHKLPEISSFVADLPSVVQKFWEAVARPLFELSISLVVVYFALSGDKQIEPISAQLSAISPSQIPEPDTYGIRAVIPFAVFIFLLGISQGNSKLLRVIGAAIPGQLVSNRTNLLLRNADKFDIGQAWQYNSALGNLHELNTEIDAAISRAPVDPATDTFSKVRAMQGRSDLLASTSAFIKGLFAVTTIIAVVLAVFAAWPIYWRNLAVIFAISSISLIYLAFCRIQAEREYACRKVKDYNFQRKMQGSTPPRPDEHRLTAIDSQADQATTVNSWTLKFVPPDVKSDLCALGKALVPIVKS